MNESWCKALLVCGILSSLLYGAMIGAIGFDGYSRISQTPSELTALGAPTRSLWMQLGAVYTVLVTAFGGACGRLPVKIVRCESWVAC